MKNTSPVNKTDYSFVSLEEKHNFAKNSPFTEKSRSNALTFEVKLECLHRLEWWFYTNFSFYKPKEKNNYTLPLSSFFYIAKRKEQRKGSYVAYFSLLKNLVKHDRFSDFLASARNFFTVPAFHCYFLALRKKGETKFCWKLRRLGIDFCAILQTFCVALRPYEATIETKQKRKQDAPSV